MESTAQSTKRRKIVQAAPDVSQTMIQEDVQHMANNAFHVKGGTTLHDRQPAE